MSRIIQESKQLSTVHLPALPIVDWEKIGEQAPEIIDFSYQGPDASLPSADIVVITWTSAEWSALDHVFVNSQTIRKSSDESWQSQWYLYSKNAPKSYYSTLWGYFRLIKINDKTVLLFKSEAHLAHPNYIDGLEDMVKCIIADVQPKIIYSIGTAGGSSLEEVLGDTVITNSGHIILEKKENLSAPYNNQTISCNWFPALGLQEKITDNLLMPLNQVLTPDELNNLLDKLHEAKPDSAGLTLADLVNEPLDPNNLMYPKMLPSKDIPLLTTDYYFIANGNDSSQYCTLEMDDTVVGYVAGEEAVNYIFVRNISDPIVVSNSASGAPIADDIREEWSSLIYQTCGFYTSFNGALTTWACIAGN